VQDPFNEDDWESYTAFTARNLAQIVGDDLLCTNPVRVQKAIDTKACNALLLKVGGERRVQYAVSWVRRPGPPHLVFVAGCHASDRRVPCFPVGHKMLPRPSGCGSLQPAVQRVPTAGPVLPGQNCRSTRSAP
jgi:hypothetical protein